MEPPFLIIDAQERVRLLQNLFAILDVDTLASLADTTTGEIVESSGGLNGSNGLVNASGDG